MSDYFYIDSDIEIRKIINYPEQLKTLVVYVKADGDNRYKKVTNQYYINDTAYEILCYIDGINTLQDISNKLAQKYNDNSENVHKIVCSFLENLKKDYNLNIIKKSFPSEKKIRIVKMDYIYPITASIELTTKCNIKCLHCYGDYQSKGIEMSLFNAKKLLYDLDDMGVKNIEFTGGDISVHPYLYEILKIAYSLKFSAIVLLTNGIYMQENIKQLISKNSDRTYIQVDVHSLNEDYLLWFTGRNQYLSSIVDNIKFYVKNNVKIRVATIVTKRNLGEIGDIANLLNKLGVKDYIISLVVDIGRAHGKSDLFLDNGELNNYINQINEIKSIYPDLLYNPSNQNYRKNCGCLTTNVSIKSNGDIKLCAMDENNFKFGNVFETNIRKLYDQNKEVVKELFYLEAPQIDRNECKDCNSRFFCANCMIRTMIKVKEMKKTNEKCKWYDNNLKESLRKHFIV